MQKASWDLNALLLAVVLLLVFLSLRLTVTPTPTAFADSGRYDYVTIISPGYLYQGKQGVLVLDRRTADVWFFAKTMEMEIRYEDPVLVTHLPLENLDLPPR